MGVYKTADFLDCSLVVQAVIETFEDAASDLGFDGSAMRLLQWASDTNQVMVAKIAIEAGALPSYTRYRWYDDIKNLGPQWQIELTRLSWTHGHQLVARDTDKHNIRANGKTVARRKETIWFDSRLSDEEIASRFDPAPCAYIHCLLKLLLTIVKDPATLENPTRHTTEPCSQRVR